MKLTNKAILLLIIIAAGIIRFYNYFDIPFTHDEFSALFRTHFNSFSELIEKGVKTDTHPAGVQIFLYYWTKLFGYAEWVVKMPFTIFGILSIPLIYFIAKSWYNESVGLISAAFLTATQISVMYSQIARPYISGMFFSLLMVFFWTKILFSPQKRYYLNMILYIITASVCAYNHYFSLLFAAIVGLSGLFFIQKNYLLKYILSGVLIFALYIPHLGIFSDQLKMGGIESWLSKPHADFIFNYIGYIFNFSAISFILVLLLILFGLFKIEKKDLKNKYLILSLTWFFLPFLTGFFYSTYVNSVLQYSVLIFSFPFLFFVLFGHIKPQKAIINLFIVLAILSVNLFSLVKERKHFELFYNSPYEQILVEYQKARKSTNNMAAIIDSHKEISGYYISKLPIDTVFIWYNSFKTEKDFINYLKKQSQLTDYLYFGCLSENNPITVPVIQDFYPTIKWQKNYAGATCFLFTKEKQKEDGIIEKLDFESNHSVLWSSVEKAKFIDTVSYSGNVSYRVDRNTEWSPTYRNALKNIISNENNFIDISLKVYFPEKLTMIPEKYNEIILVASLDSRGKNIHWDGEPFDTFISKDDPADKWISIHHSIKLSDVNQNYRDIQLGVYVWNKGKQDFIIDDFTIKLRKGNPVVYGLNENF